MKRNEKSEIMSSIMAGYLNDKPEKTEVQSLIMVMLDYITDDHNDEHMTVKEFWTDAHRKHDILENLIEKWRKK